MISPLPVYELRFECNGQGLFPEGNVRAVHPVLQVIIDATLISPSISKHAACSSSHLISPVVLAWSVLIVFISGANQPDPTLNQTGRFPLKPRFVSCGF